MKLHLYSDLHLDHYADWGAGFQKAIEPMKADVAVLAGDITTGKFHSSFQQLFKQLVDQYRYVLVVPGNHEYYGCDEAQVLQSYKVAMEGLEDRVFLLDNSYVTLDGQMFLGGTMWYQDRYGNTSYEHWMNDIHRICNFKPWVYKKNLLFENMIRGRMAKGDVVISHHLPSKLSVAKAYSRSPLNRFFVHDMENLIIEREPALWLHGHTHDDCDYKIGETRIICNPRGYPGERFITYAPKEIEL